MSWHKQERVSGFILHRVHIKTQKHETITDNQLQNARAAIEDAKQMIGAALIALNEPDEDTKRLLGQLFFIENPSKKDLSDIKSVLGQTKRGLGSRRGFNVKLFDAAPAGDLADMQDGLQLGGYTNIHKGLKTIVSKRRWYRVNPSGNKRYKTGDIHVGVTLGDSDKTVLTLAENIVHESTHRYAGTVDHSYIDWNDLSYYKDNMNKKKALVNADSYSKFCAFV